jgi:carbon monoxide dehydrogenase subunit G
MKLEQSFTVEAPVERVWAAMIDVERIAPCLPGAEVTGVDDTGAYQGTFSVKLGPTTAAYRGTLRLDAVDEAARTATMSAKGTDKRGQGGASATIVSTMREAAGVTQVDVLTDFHITGRLARFGRSGMIEDISKRLMRDFAQCLQATIVSGGAAEPDPSAGGAGLVSADPAAEAAAGGLSAEDAEAADAAVASASGAAAEAASASAAPPGAKDLAAGPAAPAPEPPATPPPLVGRPVDRPAAAPADAEPAGEPAAEPARTGWLSDWPDGGAEDEAAKPAGEVPPERPVGEPLASPRVEPPAPEPPAAPEPSTAEPLSPPRAEPPASEPPAPEPLSSPPPEPPAPEPEETPVRTESIPPPGRPDRAVPQAARRDGGLSAFFSALGGRITRLFGRKKT